MIASLINIFLGLGFGFEFYLVLWFPLRIFFLSGVFGTITVIIYIFSPRALTLETEGCSWIEQHNSWLSFKTHGHTTTHSPSPKAINIWFNRCIQNHMWNLRLRVTTWSEDNHKLGLIKVGYSLGATWVLLIPEVQKGTLDRKVMSCFFPLVIKSLELVNLK